jgi:hypothetical protein
LALNGWPDTTVRLDRETAELIDRLWALESPRNLEWAPQRVWQRLRQYHGKEFGHLEMTSTPGSTSLTRAGTAPTDKRPPSRAGQSGGLSLWRYARGSRATAAFLTVAFVGLIFAFGPGRNGWNQQEPALFAAVSAKAATPSAPEGGASTTEQINFGGADFLPPAVTAVEFTRIELAPGATVSVLAGTPGHALYVIESGTLDALFEFDVQMTEEGQAHGVLIGGEQREIEAGEGFVMESDFAGELRNIGAEPAKIAVIRISHAAASQVTDSETIPLP